MSLEIETMNNIALRDVFILSFMLGLLSHPYRNKINRHIKHLCIKFWWQRFFQTDLEIRIALASEPIYHGLVFTVIEEPQRTLIVTSEKNISII